MTETLRQLRDVETELAETRRKITGVLLSMAATAQRKIDAKKEKLRALLASLDSQAEDARQTYCREVDYMLCECRALGVTGLDISLRRSLDIFATSSVKINGLSMQLPSARVTK